LRSNLESMAAGAPVRFLGEVPHARVPELLRDSRALVLCSSVEGVPNVVLEALAHNRPVIATPVGAIPELVEDGVNGRLVPVGDPEALAAAMRDLLDDATWMALAGAARPSVEKFSWPRLVDQVESELEALGRDSRRRT
jgi:glycosyltransferase involved in cell wall biosynthesis